MPTRGQCLIELPIEFLAGVVRGTGGKRWRQFAPLIFAIFLFVLTANWLSLLPGVGTIGLAEMQPMASRSSFRSSAPGPPT